MPMTRAEITARWKAKDPERYKALRRAAGKRWRAKHPEKVVASNQVRHAANADLIRARKRLYYQAVRKQRDKTEQGRYLDRERKAKRRGAIAGDRVTLEEWQAICTAHGGRCRYCRRDDLPLEQDHVLALSRGGRHIASNVVPSCKPCNSAKGAR